MRYNSASLSSQPPYEGGATSGNPGIVKQDRGYGTSTTTDSQTIFDIDAFIATGFDKPERANLESWGSGGGPNKVAYSNIPLAQIPAGNITTSNPSGELMVLVIRVCVLWGVLFKVVPLLSGTMLYSFKRCMGL